MIEPSGEYLTLRNLVTGTGIEFNFLPTSDRGAGYAVFSPGNGYAAWMEASGTQMAEVPDFVSTVRIASINGGSVVDLPNSVFSGLVGSGQVSWTEPVGWLDATTLLVEVRMPDWNSVGLVAVNFDGTNARLYAMGSFAGFFYP